MITYAQLDERIRLFESEKRIITRAETDTLKQDFSSLFMTVSTLLKTKKSGNREDYSLLNALAFDFFQDTQSILFDVEQTSRKHSRLYALIKNNAEKNDDIEKFSTLPEIFARIVALTEQDGGSNERTREELNQLLEQWS